VEGTCLLAEVTEKALCQSRTHARRDYGAGAGFGRGSARQPAYCAGASRVLARIGSFMAFHLAQIDKRARKFPWAMSARRVLLRVQGNHEASKILPRRAASTAASDRLRESLGVTSRRSALWLKVRYIGR